MSTCSCSDNTNEPTVEQCIMVLPGVHSRHPVHWWPRQGVAQLDHESRHEQSPHAVSDLLIAGHLYVELRLER